MTESALLEKIYVEVEARLGNLERQLDQASEKGRKAAKGIEDVFTKGQLKFNDSLAKKSIAEIEQSAIRLRAHLEKRIEMGAPLYQLEALKNSLDKAENAVSTFKRKTDEVPPSLERVGKSANGVFGSLKSLFAGLGGIFAGYQIFDFLKGSVEESKQAAQSLAKVEQAIRTTGGAAGFSSEQLQNMAGDLEELAGIDGDQIMNDVTAQLLTFTNVAGTSFVRAQRAALDLSAVIGTDLKGQTIQLGKALEDPVTGMTALRRAGVTFTEAQQAQIKSLIAANDLFGAQNIILKEIETKYGGQAAAMNKASGGIMSLSTAWGNLKEAVGNLFTPLLTTWLPKVTEGIKGWVYWINKLRGINEEIAGKSDRQSSLREGLKGTTPEFRASELERTRAEIKATEDKYKAMRSKLEQQIGETYDTPELRILRVQAATLREYVEVLKHYGEVKDAVVSGNATITSDPKPESEVEKIVKKEDDLKKVLDEVNKALTNGNLSQFARNELIAKQIELTKELAKYNRIINPDLGSIKPQGLENLKINGKISGVPKELQKLPELQKPGVSSEVTFLEREQLDLTESLTEGFNNAGNALAQAMGQGVVAFKQANSLLQQFINGLVSAMVQAFALKAVMMAFNWLTGGIGGAAAAIPSASGSLAAPTGGISAGPLTMSDFGPMLKNIDNSIQSLNINMMKAKSVKPTINVNIDGKRLVLESIDPEMKNLQKQNYLKS